MTPDAPAPTAEAMGGRPNNVLAGQPDHTTRGTLVSTTGRAGAVPACSSCRELVVVVDALLALLEIEQLHAAAALDALRVAGGAP